MSTHIMRMVGLAFVLAITSFVARADIVGTPWTGDRAAVLTTAEVIAHDAANPRSALAEREANPRRPIPNARNRVRNPNSPEFPVSRPNPHAPLSPSAREFPGPEFANRVAASFTGITYPESGGFVPPDSHGDVGPTQVLAVVNSTIRTIDKATGMPDGVLNVSANNFFAPVRDGSGISDQRAIYDRLTQRWFIVTINTSLPNRVLIATSNTAVITPATVWSLYQFQQDLVSPVGQDAGLLCDYPNAGIDVNAVYIGCDMFDNSSYYGSTLFVVRKSSVLSGGPIVVTVFRDLMGEFVDPVTPGPNTPMGVTNFDPAATEGYFIGQDNATLGTLDLVKISDPGGAPVMAPFIQITTAAFQSPIPDDHLGNDDPGGPFNGFLDGSDNRVMNASIHNGTIWLAHGTALDSAGDGGALSPDRNGVRWYQLGDTGAGPGVLQSGTIYDPSGAQRSYTYGSVAVNGQGHAAFGFTLVGPNDYAGVATDGRLLTDPSGTTQGVQLATAGLAAYVNTFDTGSGPRPRRWGDFSSTQVDPDDNMTFWTIQEYTEADGTWATRVVKLQVPPPAAPVSASPATVAPGFASVRVNIAGAQVSGSGFYDPGPGYAKRIAAAIPGVTVNGVTYNGPTSVTLDLNTVGAPSGSRNVTIVNPDGQSATGNGILTIGAAGGKSGSTTSIAGSLDPSAFGQSVTFTAHVAAEPPGTGTPTGTVTFHDGVTPLGTSPLAAGVATLSTGALTIGTHGISATYNGDASFYNSHSMVLTQHVLGTAAVLTVQNNGDAGAGSLRATIAAANPGDAVVFNTGAVTLTCPATITLTTGELVVDKSLTIIGPGARCLAISGNNASRVFALTVPGSAIGISGLTIRNGNAVSGGGLLNLGTNLTLTAVAIVNNNGQSGLGGGIDNESGGALTIANSTIAGNVTTNRGGGIQSQGGPMTIVNSTISGNTSLVGAGIRNAGGVTTTLIHSTVAGNSVTGPGALGGNLSALNGIVELRNTIVTLGASTGFNPNLDSGGGTFASLDYNQLDSTDGYLSTSAHDVIAVQSPTLPALANNGGPTDTRVPTSSNVINAIPAGGGCNGAAVTIDQRGIARPQGGTCDIGAVETGIAIGGGATTTALGSSLNPSTGGKMVTLTATVTGTTPTGTVTFFDGAAILGNGTVASGIATLGTSALAVGTHVLSASYSGDANNASSASTPINQGVLPAATTTSLGASVDPIVPGGSVTFTATVSPPPLSAAPTGIVGFYDGGALLGQGALSGGVATLVTNALTNPGPHDITAVYGGSPAYHGSTSAVFVETVTGGAGTTTALKSSLNPSTFGAGVTFTATVSVQNGMPTGTVTFKDGATTIGTAPLSAGGAAAYTTTAFAVGTHGVTAVYGGDGSFTGSTSAALSQVVNPAGVTLARTFVSSLGVDTNPCSLVSTCRSLIAAMAVTSPGGEVIVVDSAGYGPIVVSKPISIVAPPGVYAGISVPSGTGIVVNPGIGKVTLRGLTINSLGGDIGIDFQSGEALYVEGTIVTGFGGAGIRAMLPAPAKLFVRDSNFRNNGTGMSLATDAGVVRPLDAMIERTQLEGNATGIALTGWSVAATIRNSLVTGGGFGIALQPTIAGATSAVDMRNTTVSKNGATGVRVGGGAGTVAVANVVSSQVTDNGIGIDALTGGTAYVTDTTITRNTTGVAHVSGTAVSLGDNRLTNNGSNGTFSSTTPKQ